MVNRFLPRLAALAMLAALGGCTWAPGPALDGSRIQDDLSAKTGTDVYPVKLITADVVRAQPDSIALAAAVPDSPARVMALTSVTGTSVTGSMPGVRTCPVTSTRLLR